MDLSRVILGPVVTEKAERLKADPAHRTYTLHVSPSATKVDVRNAIEHFYDVSVASIRVMKTRPKTRQITAHQSMEKRHATRKVMVTLTKNSKALDLTSFRTR